MAGEGDSDLSDGGRPEEQLALMSTSSSPTKRKAGDLHVARHRDDPPSWVQDFQLAIQGQVAILGDNLTTLGHRIDRETNERKQTLIS